MVTLTGKRRLRLQTFWFRAPMLVLQVEYYSPPEMRYIGSEGPFPEDSYESLAYHRWRDATVEDMDLLVLNLEKGL